MRDREWVVVRSSGGLTGRERREGKERTSALAQRLSIPRSSAPIVPHYPSRPLAPNSNPNNHFHDLLPTPRAINDQEKL